MRGNDEMFNNTQK